MAEVAAAASNAPIHHARVEFNPKAPVTIRISFDSPADSAPADVRHSP
jgi:hypothetical protein